MGKYEVLTKYILKLKGGNLGTWVIDKESDGTPEHPLQFPFVNYSQIVDHFQDDLFRFCEGHPEYEHIHYGDTLRENGIDWGSNSMESVEKSRTVQNVNTQNLRLMQPDLWRPDDTWPAADRRG